MADQDKDTQQPQDGQQQGQPAQGGQPHQQAQGGQQQPSQPPAQGAQRPGPEPPPLQRPGPDTASQQQDVEELRQQLAELRAASREQAILLAVEGRVRPELADLTAEHLRARAEWKDNVWMVDGKPLQQYVEELLEAKPHLRPDEPRPAPPAGSPGPGPAAGPEDWTVKVKAPRDEFMKWVQDVRVPASTLIPGAKGVFVFGERNPYDARRDEILYGPPSARRR